MRERVETQTTCSACGKDTTVPFRPDAGTPGVLQGVLPAAEVCRRRRRLARGRALSRSLRQYESQGQAAGLALVLCVKIAPFSRVRGTGMQIEERAAGDVTILDLKGR